MTWAHQTITPAAHSAFYSSAGLVFWAFLHCQCETGQSHWTCLCTLSASPCQLNKHIFENCARAHFDRNLRRTPPATHQCSFSPDLAVWWELKAQLSQQWGQVSNAVSPCNQQVVNWVISWGIQGIWLYVTNKTILYCVLSLQMIVFNVNIAERGLNALNECETLLRQTHVVCLLYKKHRTVGSNMHALKKILSKHSQHWLLYEI